jgi:hypothetical protein
VETAACEGMTSSRLVCSVRHSQRSDGNTDTRDDVGLHNRVPVRREHGQLSISRGSVELL